MCQVMERKVNRMVRIKDGELVVKRSPMPIYISIRYDIYFPHPQQFSTSTLRRRYISSSSMRRELSFFLFSAFAQNVTRRN